MMRLKLPLGSSGGLQDRPPFQLRTVTYNDEAAPWNRKNHVLRSTWLPSSEDSGNNFSGTLEEQKLR
jgi:hypothetical protein